MKVSERAIDEAREALLEAAGKRCRACHLGWTFDGDGHLGPAELSNVNKPPGQMCKAQRLRRAADGLAT